MLEGDFDYEHLRELVLVTNSARELLRGQASRWRGLTYAAFYDYWQNLANYAGRYPLGSGVALGEALSQQISRYAPEEMSAPLLSYRRHLGLGQLLFEYLTQEFTRRSEYLVVGERIERVPSNTCRLRPQGYELLDLYVEAGMHLVRWGEIDPHMQIATIAVEASSNSGDTLEAVVRSVDEVLGTLQIA